MFFCDIIQIMDKVKTRFKMSPSLQIMLGFMLLILIGTFLLCLPISNQDGRWLSFVDGLFTSTSAVCVTGLQVFDIGAQLTLFGQIVMLVLVQFGGLGIVALTSFMFLILRKKINFSNRLAIKESLNKDNIQGVVRFIKKVIIITFAIEFVGALCLLYSTITYTGSVGKGIFAAIFLAVSAFCNAGFDVFGSETQQFLSFSPLAGNVLFLLPIMLLIVCGGIGFIVLLGGIKNLKKDQHSKLVIIISSTLVMVGAIVFMCAEWNNSATIGDLDTGAKIMNSFFQSITTRTAGFATFDQTGLTSVGAVTSMLLMIIGGSPMSVAGGIKTTTFFVLLLLLFKRPNNNGSIILGNKKISNNMIMKAIKIFLYYIAILIVGVVLISIFEGGTASLMQIAYECVSAMSTVGLSMGLTPMLSVFSKIIITMLMFVGRVGMMTVVLAISIKNTDVINQVEYMNSNIIIG